MTAFVVVKNRQYLVGVPYVDTKAVRWSVSRSDAMRFRVREDALKVANIVGGRVEEINTITGVVIK